MKLLDKYPLPNMYLTIDDVEFALGKARAKRFTHDDMQRLAERLGSDLCTEWDVLIRPYAPDIERNNQRGKEARPHEM